MSPMRLLLLGNSTNYGQGYLEHAETAIKDFLGEKITRVLFVPFASVRRSFDDFTAMVRERFQAMGYELISVHEADDPPEAVRRAEAMAVGGGNTFHLLSHLYTTGLLETIRACVNDGTPYIGWSAGANVACPTIQTTNDMPVVEPPNFAALGLVPFQINPHYTDAVLPQHSGETRAERIAEFVQVNPGVYVVGLREGSILRVEGSSIELLGDKEARVFIKGQEATDCAPGATLEFLLK